MKDKECPKCGGFEWAGHFPHCPILLAKETEMKNQLQTAITQRDRAVQVALNFVGHHISSSDGSYDLLKECVYDAIREAYAEGAAEQIAVTAKAERQECLKILQKAYQGWFDGDHSPAEAFRSAKERIQARMEGK